SDRLSPGPSPGDRRPPLGTRTNAPQRKGRHSTAPGPFADHRRQDPVVFLYLKRKNSSLSGKATPTARARPVRSPEPRVITGRIAAGRPGWRQERLAVGAAPRREVPGPSVGNEVRLCVLMTSGAALDASNPFHQSGYRLRPRSSNLIIPDILS